MERKLLFTQEKITKGAVRFKEAPVEDDAPLVGTIYVRKNEWEGIENVKALSVTIES